MASQIDVVFNADTGRYVANVNAATGATQKNADAVALAKNKILDAMEAQIQKAVSLGASQQRLQSIAEKAASQMSAVTEQNANRIIHNLDRIAERNKQVAAELGNLKVPKVSDHSDVTNRQASSAFLRGGGLRADETFLASIPGAANMVQSLFPLIGAAGLAGLLFDMGEKGYEAFEKVRHAAELTRQAFEEQHDKAQITIDDKEIENQKIQDQIDKISGKPNNGLAMSLLEAKKMSDQLIASMKEVRSQEEAIFKQNDTGKFGQALSLLGFGPQSTGVQEKQILQDGKDLEQKLRDASRTRNTALQNAPDDAARQAATKAYNKSVHDAFQERIDTYQREVKRLQDAEKPHLQMGAKNPEYVSEDHSTQIANMRGVLSMLQDKQQDEMLDESIYGGNQQLGRARQAKEDAANAREAARKAFEAQKEAWKQEDDARAQRPGGDTPLDSMTAWQNRMAKSTPNSEQWKYANYEYTTVLKEWGTKNEAAVREATERQQKAQREAWELQHDDWAAAGHRTAQDEADYWSIRTLEAVQGSENYRMAAERELQAEREIQREREAADKARGKAALESGQQQTHYAEAMLKIRQMTGQVSPQDASVQLANIHTEQYRQKQAALQAELERQQGLDPNSAGTVEAQAAVDKAAADRRIQVQEDAATMAAQTWEGALKNANAVWVQDAEDSAKQVVQLWQQAFNGLNSNLENLMVGDKSNFAGMFKGIGKTLGGDALKRVEAPVMKAFGIEGKPDGSSTNPLHVILAGTMGQGTLSGLGASMGGVPKLPKAIQVGGDDDDDDSDGSDSGTPAAGGFVGSLVKFAGMLFGGHRALGGRVSPGVSYDVGEMGRETFVPDQPGSIVPNNQLSGNVAYYNVSVGNGVTPEQMNMHMQSVLREYHPHVVRASVQAMHDHNARKPAASH